VPVFRPTDLGRLINLASRDRVAPIYLFIGPEEEALAKARKILKVLLQKGALWEQLDLSEDTAEKIPLLLSEAALFGSRKMVLVKKAENLPASPELVESIAQKISPEGPHLFLLAESFPEDHSLYRIAQEKGVILPLAFLKGRKRLLAELPLFLSEANKKMDRATAEYFLSLVGEDYLRFQNEFEKLVLYVGEREVITREDVEAVVSPDEEAALFLLGDRLLDQGPEAARGVLRRLLDTGEDPRRTFAALVTYFKRLWLLHYLLQKAPDLLHLVRYEDFERRYQGLLKETWAEKAPAILAKLHPYAVFRLKRHLRSFSPEIFPRLFYALWELDMALKKDFRDPQRAFYEFFIRVWEIQKRGVFQKSPPGLESFGAVLHGT